MYEISVIYPDGTEKKHNFDTKEVLIGRRKNNHLVLPALSVSSRHAKVYLDNNKETFITDLGSTNGTYVNKTKIIETKLITEEDVIHIPPYNLCIRYYEPTEEELEPTVIEKVIEFIDSQNKRTFPKKSKMERFLSSSLKLSKEKEEFIEKVIEITQKHKSETIELLSNIIDKSIELKELVQEEKDFFSQKKEFIKKWLEVIQKNDCNTLKLITEIIDYAVILRRR